MSLSKDRRNIMKYKLDQWSMINYNISFLYLQALLWSIDHLFYNEIES